MAKTKEKGRMRRRSRLAWFIAPAVFSYGVLTCLASDRNGKGGPMEPPLSFDVANETVLVIDPDRSGAESGLPLEAFGLRDGEELRCFVGDLPVACKVVTGRKADRPARVQLELAHHDLPPGQHSIRLTQGRHIHIRRAALYVARGPRLNDVSCGDRDAVLELPAKQAVELSVAPHSGSNLRVLLDDEDLEATPIAEGRMRVQVPAEIPGDARLKLVEEAGDFGPIPLCERRVAARADGYRLDGVTLTYVPAEKRVQARLSGTGLPDVLTAKLADMDRPVTFQVTENEGQARTYGSEPVAQRSDRFLSFELAAGGKLFHESRGRWLAANPDLWSFKELESQLEFDLDEIFEEKGSGEVEIGGEVFSFGRIAPRQIYTIGLSEERSLDPRLAEGNLAKPSSHPSGVLSLELREGFLMSHFEITNGQFLAYARQSGLTPARLPEALRPYLDKEPGAELASLPVTSVSFVDVRSYVTWLQARLDEAASKWQVRLPHELEWEMAARGNRPWDYAFKDQDQERGLASLEKEGPRPVGANPMDRSPFGIRDMTGNVREWTNTVYDEQMLEYLGVYMTTTSLADGWDPTGLDRLEDLRGVYEKLPANPAETPSRKITVRGGANGEAPWLMLVSLRRSMETREADEDVGFRLVLVPRKEL